MEWNCTLTEERLGEYLDGKLSPAESTAFSAHAAGCMRCMELGAEVSELVSRMHKLEMVKEPPSLVAKILDSTLGPQTQKESWKQWFGWTAVLVQPRFTMGLATVAACCLIVLYATGVSPAKLRKADLSPANVFHTANRQAHLTYARGVKFVNDLRVVYEIQSKLQPEPLPEPLPARPATQPEHNLQPPNPDPQRKSQNKPHPNRSNGQSNTLFAFLVSERADRLIENTSHSSARSLR
jgi:hypothetical protein